ncbi:segregation and condensation protein A [Zavarzinia compransoris]|uniref:Segregation and condensation protein A n=1 Tax=Zavarzinia compransoris TaxID=1264899 RepID=A0A317EC21_9PROT|nr:ScpA family protein [Zavarzinia compransoris]PWR23660.1 segregation/condensation protein A [Zavarzinia compransoris]TDP47878.1 condensin subunit ScpA [Zavarzinia compransoris]
MSEPSLPFEDKPPAILGEDGEILTVDVEGFEGPLDLLLALAKAQKVDLKKISILKLADQYLIFVNEARRLRLELAADYLVMAAWLAYLKSRLMLPEPPAGEEPSGEELAARMALQLERLEAIRAAAAKLMSRHQLGRDVFARGAPEGVTVVRRSNWSVGLYDLIKAYADWAARKTGGHLTVKLPPIFTMEAAIERLSSMLGVDLDWTRLEMFMPAEFADPLGRRSALAGTFAASLELVRQGKIQLRQTEPFAPIFIRKARDE